MVKGPYLLVIHTKIFTDKGICYIKFASKYGKGEMNKGVDEIKLAMIDHC